MSETAQLIAAVTELSGKVGKVSGQVDGLHEKVDDANGVAKDNAEKLQSLTQEVQALNFVPLEEHKEVHGWAKKEMLKEKTQKEMKEQLQRVGLMNFAGWGAKTILTGLGLIGIAAYHGVRHFLGLD